MVNMGTLSRDPIETRLKELKIVVPELSAPVGLYVPAISIGNLIVTSGQLPKSDGRLDFKGKLGRELDVETGKRAARLALVNALAAVRHALGGSWQGFKRVVQLRVAVASTLGFNEQAAVADGASELLIKIFGDEKGSHARFAWGVIELPLGASVELELSVEVNAKRV